MRIARFATGFIALVATLLACRSAERSSPDSASVVNTTYTVTAMDTTAPDSAAAGAPVDDDACWYADAPRPEPATDESVPYDSAALANGVTYRCRLGADGPEVRLVVLGEWSVPMAIDVYSPADAPGPLQRLFMEKNQERAREGARLVRGEDLNGDGWTDLLARTFSGSGGTMYDVFLYRAADGRFEKDTVLSDGIDIARRAGRPCARAGGRMGVGIFTTAEFCWSAEGWVLARTVNQARHGRDRYIRTTHERVDGLLQVVRVDTLSDPHEGLH